MRVNFADNFGNTSKHIGHSSSSSSRYVVVDDEVDFLSLSSCCVDVVDDVSFLSSVDVVVVLPISFSTCLSAAMAPSFPCAAAF